jgi:hypothetical protein
MGNIAARSDLYVTVCLHDPHHDSFFRKSILGFRFTILRVTYIRCKQQLSLEQLP